MSVGRMTFLMTLLSAEMGSLECVGACLKALSHSLTFFTKALIEDRLQSGQMRRWYFTVGRL